MPRRNLQGVYTTWNGLEKSVCRLIWGVTKLSIDILATPNVLVSARQLLVRTENINIHCFLEQPGLLSPKYLPFPWIYVVSFHFESFSY